MAARASGWRGILARVGNLLLTLLALGGAVCIALVPLAFVFHISLIMFKTGSMTPTIPAGSLAVVRQIPASAVHVGDVVTVDRTPLLPVTHRVVAIANGDGPVRLLTLRGDANQTNDAEPYAVTHVRLVEWSAPKLAHVVRAMSNVYVMTGITLGAAGIVTWAFWPRANELRTRRRRVWHRQATVVVLLGVSAAALATPGRARAATSEEVIRGTYLTLTSIGDKNQMTNMTPNEPVPWQVGVAAHAKDPGTVTITLSAQGALAANPDGLQVIVAVCTARWVNGACPPGGQQVFADGPASRFIGHATTIASMPSYQQRWILITASLLAHSTLSGSADLIVTATGVGDKASAGGNVGPIARTGTNLWPPVLIGVGALIAGVLLILAARVLATRRSRSEVRPS